MNLRGRAGWVLTRAAVCMAALAGASGCHATEPEGPRCARCGMAVTAGSHWQAGARRRQGTVQRFDTPGCLVAWARTHPDDTVDPWVTEYYAPTGTRMDATQADYVTGSGVVGPMGAEMVPVAPGHVGVFTADHPGGRVEPWSVVIHGSAR